MWSDNDIDNAFRRLDPAEPEPTPFPLDAWLKLESQLDQAVIDRAVRRRLWQFFAAEVAVVALVGLGWSLWPATDSASVASKAQTAVSLALPTEKTSIAKHLQGSGASVASKPIVRQRGTMPENITPAMSGRVTTSSTIPSANTPVAVTATTVSATREAIGYKRRLPLAVATIPNTRFHSANGPEAAMRGATTFGHSANTPTYQAATRSTEAATRTSTAVAIETGTSAGTATQPEARSGTEATSNVAGNRMVAHSQATSEVAVADAASPSGGKHGAALAGAKEAATSDQIARVAVTGFAGNNVPAATTQLADAPTASLAPEANTPVALVQPTAAPLPAQLAPVALTADPLPTVVHQPRFYVGVVAAPDVSTVKFAGVQSPHLNIGLTLDYRLGQRLRLSTGVLRSTKTYAARRDDYDWGIYQDRVYAHDFQNVDGSCTVLDIPLNIRYDLLVRPTYRLTGSAGLSSFFMQHESYYYDWTDATGLHTWNGAAENQNRHLLSILNLSAGAEYGLNTRWSIVAEPYVKVPLAGVGLGKVKLLSAGVYFGVKYGF